MDAKNRNSVVINNLFTYKTWSKSTQLMRRFVDKNNNI
jgi:hypothetical protein